MASAETKGLQPNERPRGTSVPRGAEPDTSGGNQTTPDPKGSGDAPAAAASGKGRGRRATVTKKKPEPLKPEELQSLGQLMADAAALGQSVEAFVGDLRGQLAAHDRLLEITSHGD